MLHTGDRTPAPLELRRERVIKLLCEQVAADALSLEEFERRVEGAHRATSMSALDALVHDLKLTPAPAQDATPGQQLAEPTHRRESQVLVAIMGGVTRRGPWVPARHSRLVAIMGGAELDFRDAEFGPGVTELSIFAIMGGAEIIVPPGLAVECDGVGIIGGFEHHAGSASRADATAPLLRINGVALMGGVEVNVRLPGETAADARRRRRVELRALRKEQRQLNKTNRSGRGW